MPSKTKKITKKKNSLSDKNLMILAAMFVVLLAIALFSGDGDKENADGIKINSSSDDLVGENYQTVIAKLESNGFTNIKTVVLDDLILGWFTKDGEVEDVTVNGISDFEADKRFPIDAKIVVTYHTFPVKDPVDDPDDEPEIVPNFTMEIGIRAATVAFTNRYANDVFMPDGNHYDLSKFHSYSDVSGFFMYSRSVGTWSPVNETTWHAEHFTLIFDGYVKEVNASFDISFDGDSYTLSNLTGSAPSYEDISVFADESDFDLFFIVPISLVEEDRAPVKDLAMDVAQRAFRIYGEYLYPYGFECHWWTGLIVSEQSYDGSWYFKVEVTITNAFGASRKTIAEGYINNTKETVENFIVY